MPLLRGMARTAVVAGTATAVSNRVSRRQYDRWQGQEQPQEYAQPQQPAPAPAEADPVQRLKELGTLHEQGILTDAEFAEQKSRILSSM